MSAVEAPERQLERRFPGLPWRTPIKVTVLGGGEGLACRYCIALRGLKGSDRERLFEDEAEAAWRAHMDEEHGLYVGRYYDDLASMLAERGVLRRPDGSFMEDSYDYGVWWRQRGDGAAYRLTWIGARGRMDEALAGELYLIRLPRAALAPILPPVELLCVLPPRPEGPPDGLVKEVLAGWSEVCGGDGSADWVRDRAWEAVRAGWATAP